MPVVRSPAMTKPAPRIAGRGLKLLSGLLRSPITGPPLRRVISAQAVDSRLASIDFAAEGDPAPLYMPPSYTPPAAASSAAPTAASGGVPSPAAPASGNQNREDPR
jgi:hypothetical protein